MSEPTLKQIKYAKSLGIDSPEKMSKEDLRKAIDAKLKGIPEVPVDLGLKIGTKEEAFWTNVKTRTEIEIEGLGKALKLNEAILDMAEAKLALCKLATG